MDMYADGNDSIEAHRIDSDNTWQQEISIVSPADGEYEDGLVNEALAPLSISAAPETVLPLRSPSVEIITHQRSPSVEMTGYQRSPSVEIMLSHPFATALSSSHRQAVGGPELEATPEELNRWIVAVYSATRKTSFATFPGPVARIRAVSARAAAQGLIAVLVHILQKQGAERKVFEAPPGVTKCEKSITVASFTHLECDLRV